MAGVFLRARRVFHHGVAGARTEHQAFKQGIAGQAIGAVNASGGRFARCVEAWHAGVSPKIGFDAAHHKVRSGTDRSQVAGEVETVPGASSKYARETLLEKVLGFGSHV